MMNKIKAEQFKQELIDLLYKYNISLEQFILLFENKKLVEYLGGLEDRKKDFYKYCKKIRFIV